MPLDRVFIRAFTKSSDAVVANSNADVAPTQNAEHRITSTKLQPRGAAAKTTSAPTAASSVNSDSGSPEVTVESNMRGNQRRVDRAHATAAATPATRPARPHVFERSSRRAAPAESATATMVDRETQASLPQLAADGGAAGVAPDSKQTFMVHSAAAIAAPHTSLATNGASDMDVATAAAPFAVISPWSVAWQVDRFRWPEVCCRLEERLRSQLDNLSDRFAHAIRQGRRVVLISGCQRQEGRTSLTLAIARRLAARGHSVALVDGDFEHPQMAQSLGIAPVQGSEGIGEGTLPLVELMVESLEDRVAILPTRGPAAPKQSVYPRWDAVLAELRSHFGVVLVDSAPLATTGRNVASPARWLQVDTALLVRDVRRTEVAQIEAAARTLRARGISTWGVLENFTGAA